MNEPSSGSSGDTSARCIVADAFAADDLHCRRGALARRHLCGDGVEIGALHKPLPVDPDRARVRYVDYKTREENRKRYAELGAEEIVETDIVDEGFVLSRVDDDSVDFLVANHALEHSPDPLGTVGHWLGKIRHGGILFMAVPIADRCYDQGRMLTSLEHFIDDHRQFTGMATDDILRTTREHVREFIEVSGANIREMNRLPPADPADDARLLSDLMEGLGREVRQAEDYAGLLNAHVQRINRIYDIHYHTFSPTSYERFLRHATALHGGSVIDVSKNGGGECIGIIRAGKIVRQELPGSAQGDRPR